MKFNYHPKNKLEKFGVKVHPHTKSQNVFYTAKLDKILSLKSKSKLIKFGVRVYNLLVDNFPQTFFVGGMVRDLLLGLKIADIDIATEATPEQILKSLSSVGILADDTYKKFGNITAREGSLAVEITTFRKDLKSGNRYNAVDFIKNPKVDSQRRDFTVNALYLSQKKDYIKDFHNGLADIKAKRVKFIGKAESRMKQDPLRILRALRFCLALNFKLEKKTKLAIKNNFYLLNKLTQTKIKREVGKLKSNKNKKILEKVINNPKLLDKYFK